MFPITVVLWVKIILSGYSIDVRTNLVSDHSLVVYKYNTLRAQSRCMYRSYSDSALSTTLYSYSRGDHTNLVSDHSQALCKDNTLRAEYRCRYKAGPQPEPSSV